MSPMVPSVEEEIEYNYTINYIGSYAEARRYLDMTSWCIVISEESFNAYTANGNRFYFCGNGEWWDVPCIPCMNFPHDRFGYSLIAVEVSPENKIVSITSRWNTCAGDAGDFITEDELKSILGIENYNKLFCNPVEDRTQGQEQRRLVCRLHRRNRRPQLKDQALVPRSRTQISRHHLCRSSRREHCRRSATL